MKKLGSILFLIAFAIFTVFYLGPAFRGDIEVQPDFKLGFLTIRFYGLILATALLVCWFLVLRRAKSSELNPLHLENSFFWIVIFAMIGARLYAVLGFWNYFHLHLLEIPQFWRGGLGIYGAIGGGIGGVFIYSKIARFEVWKFLDILVSVLPLGQAIGRFGNFFNQEAFGPPTSLPWRMYVSPAHRPLNYLNQHFFHPAFLYEALWDILVFLTLTILLHKTKKSGVIFGSYLILYPAGRFFIEYFRVDSVFVHGIKLNQAVSAILIFAGLLVVYLCYASKKSETSS